MSIQLTNFSQNYQSAVTQIKQIKQINQNLISKSITSTQLIHYEQQVKICNNKVTNILAQLQRSYLDPQTARRVELIKQQLRGQCQRYAELAQNVRNKGRNKGKDSNTNRNTANSKQEIIHSQDQQAQRNLLFDNDTQQRLNKQKTQQLQLAQSKLLNIHNITQQTNKLVYQQGQNINIIDQNMSTTLSNTKQANQHLVQANKQQKKSYKKYILLIGIICAVLLVVLGIVLIL